MPRSSRTRLITRDRSRRRASFKRKRTHPFRSMAARSRRSRARSIVVSRARRGFSRRGLGGARSIFRDVSAGIGGATVAQTVTNMVAPQFSPVAGYAGAYLAGGVRGIAGKVVLDVVTGQSGLLGMFGTHTAAAGVDSL